MHVLMASPVASSQIREVVEINRIVPNSPTVGSKFALYPYAKISSARMSVSDAYAVSFVIIRGLGRNGEGFAGGDIGIRLGGEKSVRSSERDETRGLQRGNVHDLSVENSDAVLHGKRTRGFTSHHRVIHLFVSMYPVIFMVGCEYV